MPTQLFEDVVELPSSPTLPTGTPASAAVLTARRTQNASDCLGVDAFAQRTTLTLPTPSSLSAAATKAAAAALKLQGAEAKVGPEFLVQVPT